MFDVSNKMCTVLLDFTNVCSEIRLGISTPPPYFSVFTNVACKACLMADLAPLFESLFLVCENGVLPNKKLESALTNLHAGEAIYHHKESICNWAPAAGGQLRMVATMFRDIAEFEEKKRTCLAKAHNHFP